MVNPAGTVFVLPGWQIPFWPRVVLKKLSKSKLLELGVSGISLVLYYTVVELISKMQDKVLCALPSPFPKWKEFLPELHGLDLEEG